MSLKGHKAQLKHYKRTSHNKGKNKENYEPLKKMSLTKKKLYQEGKIKKLMGSKNPFYGKTHTKETVKIIKKANKGRTPWNKNIYTNFRIMFKKLQGDLRKKRKGKNYEKQYGIDKANKIKLKISKKGKGRIFSEEHRRNISMGSKGKKVSKETRKKRSQIMKKKWKNEKFREDMIKKSIGRKQSIETINKRIKRGQEHYNWLGGISFEPYGLDFNKKLREQIRKRDDYICQECYIHQNNLKGRLIVHHIDYNKKNNNLNNLISLCRKCHAISNYNRKHWQEHFKMKMLIKELFNPQNILIFNKQKQLKRIAKCP